MRCALSVYVYICFTCFLLAANVNALPTYMTTFVLPSPAETLQPSDILDYIKVLGILFVTNSSQIVFDDVQSLPT